MHRWYALPLHSQTKRTLRVRRLLFLAAFLISALSLYMLRSRPKFTSAPSQKRSPPREKPKTAKQYLEEQHSLNQQLQRIKDAENWRLLGDIQTTGENIYYEKQTKRMLTNEANIAFFLQIAEGNILLAPRLLSRIWHPDNVYCIHFDTKVPVRHRNMFTSAVRSNRKLSNVIILPSAPVTYAGISMLLNTIESIHALLTASQKWEYYINLSGSDYPLVSATGIRRLLGRPDVSNSSISFIPFSSNRDVWDSLATHRLGRLHFDLSLGFDKTSDDALIETRALHPVLRPGNLRIQIAKGEAWVIAHRTFCQRVAYGNVARRLLTLFANMQSSPEHFFQTLAWNHKKLNRTTARHSFREILWTHQGKRSIQHPFYLDARSRNGSWSMWHVLAESPHFFARKFRLPDSKLMDHIDVHKSGATNVTANITSVSESFGVVKNRFSCVANILSPLSKIHIMPCFWKGWRARGCRERVEELCVTNFAEPPR